MATTTRQQQQQEQQFRSIPPHPLPKVTNSNNNASSSASNSISPSSPSASESVLPQSRLEGKLLPDDVDAAYHQMQHLGQKWADLHAEAEILEEAKKCILATITLFHVDNGDAKSTAEVRAHASKEYQDHIKKMVEARRLANQAKIELESVKTHLNLVRTFESSRREELKML
jgi:PAB1-binding protein PBP1